MIEFCVECGKHTPWLCAYCKKPLCDNGECEDSHGDCTEHDGNGDY